MLRIGRLDPLRRVGTPSRSPLVRVTALVAALLVVSPWPPLAHAQLACTLTQITNTTTTGVSIVSFVSINADGTRLAFRSDRDTTQLTPCPLCPGNLDGNTELFTFNTASGNFTQITNTTTGDPTNADTSAPFLNADGTRLAVAAFKDLTGGNPDPDPQVFLFDTTTGFTQITNTTDSNLAGVRSISGDGTHIALTSDGDLAGLNPFHNTEIFLFDTTTSIFTPIAETFNAGGTNFGTPAISGDGTRIAFTSENDLTGANPDLNREVFLFDIATNAFTQITNTTGGSNGLPSINEDGTRITFTSDRDTTELTPCPGCAGNADGNTEVFLFDTTTNAFTQITNTTGGLSVTLFPPISGDGTRIVFRSDRDLVPGGNADGNTEVFLFDTTTNAFTQITNTTGGENRLPSISADGTHIAFESDRDLTPGSPGNADGNIEVFLATCNLEVEVSIDIKPGGDPNSINPRSKGVIPVAILTTDTFDATTVDPLSVAFGPNGATESHGRGHIQDVDGDGDLDLVLHFKTQETGIQCGDTSASLTGQTFDGQPIGGSDAIRTVGCR